MKFDIYKRGQGKYTRLCSAFAFAAVAALGCMRLYTLLEAGLPVPASRRTTLWVATMVPAGLFVALSILIFWLINKPSWSSRKEITVSTFIVIVVVFVMAVFLGTTDYIFFVIFSWLL
jgi:preprotein translocase SecE subunit